MKIESCTYHEESDTLNILTADGLKMNILCAAIEGRLHFSKRVDGTVIERSVSPFACPI